jgi:hypothetical protein
MDFKALKKASKKSLSTLAEEANKSMGSKNYEDPDADKFWKPQRDKSGNGYAVVRFLPIGPEDDASAAPWIKMYDHAFQNPANNKWYIEKSLTTINQPDPLGEANSKLWDTGLEKNKDIARKRKRRLKFYSNVYIVKDSMNPENEGKVFLYAYGSRIFEKIKGVMEPAFEAETPMNPFDLWEGANFKIKIKTVRSDLGGRKVDLPNYDDSAFDNIAPLSDDDAEMEAIWKQCHNLGDFLDAKNFKTYEELKSRLMQVWPDHDEDSAPSAPARAQKSAPEKVAPSEDVPWSEEGEDDDMSFFKNLAEDDE